ncbi:hypothetical protein Hanom_Chr06g00503061 [Helianthus anomalus]
MRRPDLRGGRLGFSSLSRSTEGCRDDSTSPGRRTGRPLVVVSAGSSQFPAIVGFLQCVGSQSLIGKLQCNV